MTDNERLRLLTDQLEAAKKQAAEKLHHFRAARALPTASGKAYGAFLVAAVGYASAAERVEELTAEWEDAQTDAFAAQMREADLTYRHPEGLVS